MTDTHSVPVVIGKDVIENLTTGMYDNPRCVYREYVQNAADAIDEAVRQGLLKKEAAEIHIQIDGLSRSISIEDNGTGLPMNEVFSVLRNIAMSSKTRGRDKGFRGIGRLGGLAYCDELVFETSAAGEPTRSKVVWDARRLKQILNDRSRRERADEVVREITTMSYEEEKSEAHFFKVTLKNVPVEELLDEKDIKTYLQSVAPLPIDSHFSFRKKILEEAEKEGIRLDEYTLFVNEEQLFKAYSETVIGGKEISPQYRKIIDIVFFKKDAPDGSPIYWGWHSLTDAQGEMLKSGTKMRGLRLRRSNIQIGDDDRLAYLFPENRFNYYVVGEVHALNEGLVPNARRDFFNESAERSILERGLKTEVCRTIHGLAHGAAKAKSEERKIEEHQKLAREFEQKQETGFNSDNEARDMERELERSQHRAAEAEQKLSNIRRNLHETTPMGKVVGAILSQEPVTLLNIPTPSLPEKPKLRATRFEQLSESEQGVLTRVFEVISRVLGKEMAENVIRKVEEEFESERR